MVNQDAALAIKIGYIFAWACIASYYFIWGASEVAEAVDYADESGWVPDGVYASTITARLALEPVVEQE